MAGAADALDIVAVGDVYLSRDRPRSAFDGVRSMFDKADFVIGNLESTLSTSGKKKFLYPWASLKSDPKMVRGLGCFDALSLANNHGMDFGGGALVETIESLTNHGVEVVGAGVDRSAAERPTVLSRKKTKIGVLAFEATHWSWPRMRATESSPGMNVVTVSPFYPDPKVSNHSLDDFQDLIEITADGVDLLFIMLHSGIAGDYEVAVHQRALAELAIEAGADAVLGAHPHILQPVAVHNGAPIIYSLGNFVFDSENLHFPRESVLARLNVLERNLVGLELYPVYTGERGRPEIAPPGSDSFERITDLLISLSKREGTVLRKEKDHLLLPM